MADKSEAEIWCEKGSVFDGHQPVIKALLIVSDVYIIKFIYDMKCRGYLSLICLFPVCFVKDIFLRSLQFSFI